MGGCLGWLVYADYGCACFAECHVHDICCDDIDWIKCSCQNVRDIYYKDESVCKYGKFTIDDNDTGLSLKGLAKAEVLSYNIVPGMQVATD